MVAGPPGRDRGKGVVLRPGRRRELSRDLRKLRAAIREDGFIWAVIPKKPARQALGVDVTLEDVLDAALRTDLVDNKTLTFSEREHGVRLVVRRRRRR